MTNHPLFLDTDMGVDDAAALIYLFARAQEGVVALSTYGNVALDQASATQSVGPPVLARLLEQVTEPIPAAGDACVDLPAVEVMQLARGSRK